MIICGTGSYLVLFKLFSLSLFLSRSSPKTSLFHSPETESRWIFGALNWVRASASVCRFVRCYLMSQKKHQHTRSKRHIPCYTTHTFGIFWNVSLSLSLSSSLCIIHWCMSVDMLNGQNHQLLLLLLLLFTRYDEKWPGTIHKTITSRWNAFRFLNITYFMRCCFFWCNIFGVFGIRTGAHMNKTMFCLKHSHFG